jgi:LysR family transcriptional regulator, cys regulon transcriptional activator
MNFQQLRSVREAVRRGFNLTEVAQALNTSQPGVSRQIRELEDELGIEIFVREGKRLTGLTPIGRDVLPFVERMLLDAESLRRVSDDFTQGPVGNLSIATTHSQARYVLPTVVRDFRATHPEVTLELRQGSPHQVAEMLLGGEADIGIATRVLEEYDELIALPCYRWTHSVLVPAGHELLDAPVTIERLSRFPLITYDVGYTGRGTIDDAFERAGLKMKLVLTAMDADVIKTYVELGLGVGILASVAFDEERDHRLRAIDARGMFEINTTSIAVRRSDVLRAFAYEFIETFAPHLTRDVVKRAQAAPSDTPSAPL